MQRTRKKPDERRDLILAAAVTAALSGGLMHVTRADIATRANVAPSLVSHYFDSMISLRDEVMRSAVESNCLQLVAQGVAMNNPIAMAAPHALRADALASLAS